MHLRALLLVAASPLVLAPLPAFAEEAPTPQSGPATQLEDVVVRADPLNRSGRDLISSVAVIQGDALVHRRQSTLGETLSGLPGVNADTFGGGSSRPVIRGQTAPRVRVLSDGAGLMDASEVSPDHAVSGEPMLLEGIEILRGPSALLYGGGAIGGAVNLLDGKIPSVAPPPGISGVFEGRIGSADGERTGVLGLTLGAGGFAFRLEATDRDTRDYDVPFYRRAEQGHDEDHDHDHDHDHDEEAEGFDRLAGSFNDTRTLSLGGSWIGARGYVGVAYTDQRSRYGLPGHSHEYEDCHPHGSSLHCGGHGHDDDDHDHDHDHDHGAGHAPIVDLVSRRWDVRGEIRSPFAGIERIRFRGGWTDYAHDEVDDGEVSTTFTNKGHDARIEVQHAPIGGLRGVFGVQSSRSDFAAVGDEDFVPPSRTDTTALFLLEEYRVGDWRLEGAVRQEWQEARAQGRPDVEHRPFSVSASASWAFSPGYALSLSAARSQRAPGVQELYARGVHFATNTYEVGDPALKTETANSLELTLRRTEGPTTFSASLYRYDYDGYIYARTQDQHEDFRLIRYSQADAVFTGIEGEVRHELRPGLSVAVFGDRVRAELDGGDSLPRIPAGRLGVRSDLVEGPWTASLEYVRIGRQDRIAAFETETPGYDMVNATLAYDFQAGPLASQIYVRGSNLLDETALNHASFLSDVAPLRGRNLVLGVRARF